jgi:hypothetical protein
MAWGCQACTYENEAADDMCAICETQKGFDPLDNMRRGNKTLCISTTYPTTTYNGCHLPPVSCSPPPSSHKTKLELHQIFFFDLGTGQAAPPPPVAKPVKSKVTPM